MPPIQQIIITNMIQQSFITLTNRFVTLQTMIQEFLEIKRVLCTLNETLLKEIFQIPKPLGIANILNPMFLEQISQTFKIFLKNWIIKISPYMQLPHISQISKHLHKLNIFNKLFVKFISFSSVNSIGITQILAYVLLDLQLVIVVILLFALLSYFLNVRHFDQGYQMNILISNFIQSYLNMLGKDLAQSKLGQLKHLRDLNLDQMQKTKTLVIVHYCGKRISVPLFQEVSNLAQLLYNHIAKLEQAVLNNEPAWEKNSKAQIVCFQIKKESRQDFKPEKESDGDLRSDILLSLLRIQNKPNQKSEEDLVFKVDVTKVFKYLEIQPFYHYYDQEILHMYQQPDKLYTKHNDFPFYQFQRIISQSKISSTYLARKISNGHFYVVKVYASGAKTGIEDLKAIEYIQNIDQMRKDTQIKCSLLVKCHQTALIPHPEAEQGEQSDDQLTCKYISLSSPFFVRGTLEDLLKDTRYNKTKKILQMDCLNYLKELMWGTHLLHQKYNLIHRSIVPSNLYIDQNGQIKLSNYYSCIPCYDSNGHYANYSNKGQRSSAYYSRNDLQEIFQDGDFDLGQFTPPEVLKGLNYNYLVDFYTIGVIIRKLYQLSQACERVPISQNNQNLMMTMINRLTSPDLDQRQAIVTQIIQDIERQNLQANEQPLNLSNLTLQDIKIGREIELSQNKKYIQNQESYNGVDLGIITNYFRKPKIKVSLLKPQIKKLKKRMSKQKQSVKNSRQKSQKCLSKASGQSEIQRKVSKKKVGSLSKQGHHSQSRQSKLTQGKRQNLLQSPTHKKASKSKSHEKKKKQDPNQSMKLKTHQQQQHPFKQTYTILPKSPKVNPTIHLKAPNVRDKNK